MPYRYYPPPGPLLIGYDPETVLALDHLARFVEAVVEETYASKRKPIGPGQPEFDPRLLLKVRNYSGPCTGRESLILPARMRKCDNTRAVPAYLRPGT
jgi:hypothetical protein